MYCRLTFYLGLDKDINFASRYTLGIKYILIPKRVLCVYYLPNTSLDVNHRHYWKIIKNYSFMGCPALDGTANGLCCVKDK